MTALYITLGLAALCALCLPLACWGERAIPELRDSQ